MARPAHGIALLDGGEVTQQHNTHIVLIQVHHHATKIALELQHLACHHIRQTCHTADTVGHADDLAHLVGIRGIVHGFNGFAHLIQHGAAFIAAHVPGRQTLQTMGNRPIVHGVAHTQAHAADECFLRFAVQFDAVVAHRDALVLRPAGSSKLLPQGFLQSHKLLFRQGLRGRNRDRQLLPLQ